MMGRVYNSISTEHGTNECTTLVEKSERQKRLEDVVKFIDLLKSKNHIHPNWLRVSFSMPSAFKIKMHYLFKSVSIVDNSIILLLSHV